MTWSFGATGTKEQCALVLVSSEPPSDPASAVQYEHMRSILKDELARYADGSALMSLSASGHAPDGKGGDRSFSIWISGKAAPHVEVKPVAAVAKQPPKSK